MTRALAIAFLLSGCVTLEYTEEPDAIRLESSLGAGDIRECGLLYRRLEARKKPIIWDGPMVSCDAFYAPAVVKRTGGCYTEAATWHPHAASSLGLIPRRDATDFLTDRILPEPLRTVFKDSWHYYDYLTVAFYSNADLRAIWPEYACEEKS